MDSAELYAPQTAWLTNAYGQNERAKRREPVGDNAPFGAAVFFHIPGKYDGKTPVSLEFLDGQDQVVRQFTLHLKKKEKKLPPTVEDNLLPSEKQKIGNEKLTAISPGVNSLRWNLRYADATDVIGFEPGEEGDGQTDDARGPLVNPGRYTIVLHYGKKASKQTFQVALDPRIHTTEEALKQHLSLQLTLHQTIDTLDRDINAAIETRQRLIKAVATHKVTRAAATAAIDELHVAIDTIVQLNVRSSEGDVLHPMHLRSLLAFLQTNIGLDYGAPDAAMLDACNRLESAARSGEAQLRAATAAGQHLL
jgi:chorismate mutase